MEPTHEQRTPRNRTAVRLLARSSFAAALFVPALASAHMGSTKTIDAQLTDDGASVQVRVDAVDAALAVGLPMEAGPTELARHDAVVRSWLAGGITLASDAGPCTASAGELAFVQVDGKDAVAAGIDYACPVGAARLVLRDDTVFADDPAHETIVAIAGPTGTEAHVLRDGTRGITIAEVPRWTDTARSFLREGAVHLVTGWDHLLFLLSLVISAGLLAHARGLGRACKDVALVVTAFTIGHSISLALATFGLVVLPSRLVETAIAASIVLVAVLNIARPAAAMRPGAGNVRAWIAGTFGIVHGFGFSSVLAELGLPTGQRALALAAFNVGIELAQLVFVALVMLPLVWAAGHRSYARVVVQGGSLAIAIFGCVWLVERGFGI